MDRLTASEIIWRTYLKMSMWARLRRQMFNIKRNHLLEGWYSHIVIPLYFDQVWQQFGFEQCVPNDMPIYIRYSQVMSRIGSILRPTSDEIDIIDLDGLDQDIATDYRDDLGTY